MPSVATLISRAAARYLGVGTQTVARELARAAAREVRAVVRESESAGSVPSAPVPRRFARGVFALWVAGLASFGLVLLNVDLLLPSRVASVFRLVVGLVLLIEGVSLLVRRSPFRTALVARLTAGSLQHPSRMRRAMWRHLTGAGLTLLGFVWLAAGVLDLLRSALALL